MSDTIFAPATAPGRSAVAIIRISGPLAFEAARAMAGDIGALRRPALRWLRDPETGERLDQALVLAFPRPGSFTGEDCVEFQTHGGSAVVRAVLSALQRLDGLRIAQPGEFTRRALMNDRLDLSQVEGLADLIAAETGAQRRQAIGLMGGGLSSLVAAWKQSLIQVLALIEALIDFADEELPAGLSDQAIVTLTAVRSEIQRELESSGGRERLREGFEVALVGPPNAGKSTLLNRLARRDVALVSAEAGTTRDVIEVRMELGGLPVTILDMAGLREAEGIEGAGVERARARAIVADLRIFLLDGDCVEETLGVDRREGDIVTRGKSDLGDGAGVSGLTGQGVDLLLDQVNNVLRTRVTESGTISHARQRQAASHAAADILSAEAFILKGDVEFASEHLRGAVRSLDFMVGRVDVEAVLDVIFGSFCLGK